MGKLVVKEWLCVNHSEITSACCDYTREIITFGGICLMCFVYSDFKQIVQDQSSTSAHTVEVLRSMDLRLSRIEQTIDK